MSGKIVPRRPVYRWECEECDQWEIVHEGLDVARRHARGHSVDRDHSVSVLRVVEWWGSASQAVLG